MDKNTKSITKELQTNKQKADLDAKKLSAAVEGLKQNMVSWSKTISKLSEWGKT